MKSTGLTSFLLLVHAVAAAAKSGYILTFPQQLQTGARERFCFTFYNVTDDVHVNLTLTCYGEEYRHEPAPFLSGEDGCFEWQIPSHVTPGTCQLGVLGLSEADNYTFSEDHDTELVDTHQITFIQTDRPIYKPGQSVKFRVMTVTQDLKPVPEFIDSIAVQDPNGFHMREWSMVPISSGLASLSYTISKEPVLGDWKIVTNINNRKTEQSFSIEKYDLPRFQVTMKLPTILTVETKSLQFQVCAKYTYGKPVSGEMKAVICLNNTENSWYCEQNKRPCVNVTFVINGCHTFEVGTENLNLTLRTFSLLCRPYLVMSSSVTEKNTGITVTEIGRGPRVWQERVKLRFISPKYFKPFFPYHGQLKVTYPDGSPVTGETIVLKISQLRIHEELTSNNAGLVTFTLTNITYTTGFFVMTAETKDNEDIDQKVYTIYAASAKKHIKQWYSPSKSYLRLSSDNRTPLTCGQLLRLNVAYSQLPDTEIKKVFYQVVSKGNIVSAEDISKVVDRSAPYVQKIKGKKLVPRPVPVVTPTPATAEMEDEFDAVNVPHGPPGWSYDSLPGPPASPGSRKLVLPPVEPVMDEPPRTLPDLDEPSTQLENGNGDEEETVPSLYQFTWPIPVTSDTFPRLRILVYMLTGEGEVVADTMDFHVRPCFGNRVNMEFSEEVVSPDSPVGLKVTAHSGSLCSIAMVDKSVHLHGGNNLLERSRLIEKLESYDISSSFIRDWQYCSDNSDMPPFVLNPPVGPPLPPGVMPDSDDIPPPSGAWFGEPGRKKRSIMQYYSNMFDSLLAFKVSGLIAVTDLELQTRPCLHSGEFSPPHLPGEPTGPMPGPGGFLPGEEADDEEDLPLMSTTRDYFPETWLWNLEEVPSSGEVIMNKSLPHTVTEWVGSTFCTSPRVGLGVSHMTHVTSFKPFFLDVSLPYSVIRGETVPVTVTVFNYLPHCAAFQLNLTDSQEFQLQGLEGGEPQSCLCSHQSWSFTFRIRPRVLGKINITLTATLREHRVSCMAVDAPEGYKNKQITDTVVKQLQVEAEGIQIENTESFYICPQDTGHKFKTTITHEVPDSLVVPGSHRGWINVIGDIMGPVLSGLDRLVQLPTGCGEQNVLRMAPNIAVLQYLESTSQLSPEIEAKVLDHMEEGYQEQMKFMHDDGSYSAFGNADEHGSTWLSAFVFKTLRHALDYIYIDRKQVQTKTWEFLVSTQGADGCFEERGKVLSKYMQGGVLGEVEKDKSLTAYVLVAMMESFPMMRQRTPPFIALAVKCIEVEELTDTYTLALTTYAMVLYKPNSPFTNMLMEKLRAKARRDGDKLYWKRDKHANITKSRRAPSAEIEMTAYVLLAILNKDETTPISEVIPIVRWLTEQRNTYGGFSSTQDTVVALQALSEFAMRVHGQGLDVSITVSDTQGAYMNFKVSPRNSLLLQQRDIRHVNQAQHVTAKGDGCMMLQSTVRYNIRNQLLPNPSFSLNVTTPVDESQLQNCRSRKIRVCASYLETDVTSNMVIIEIRMTSGWIPDVTSLERLFNYIDLGLKKYEMDYRNPDVVNFYFDQLDRKDRCFEFTVALEFEVEDQKPVLARVYDYYETEMEATTFYEMTSCTREELEETDVDIDGSLGLEGSANQDLTSDDENDNQIDLDSDLSISSSVSSEKDVVDTTITQSAVPGDGVVLRCTVSDLGPKTVVWRKQGANTPLTVGRRIFTSDNRFHVRHIAVLHQWNLVINNVRLQDTGIYECVITDRQATVEQRVHVKVKDVSSSIGQQRGDMTPSLPAGPPPSPVCPVCVLTGTVHIMEKVCQNQVWLVSGEGKQFVVQVIDGEMISPELRFPVPDIMSQCNDCQSLFFREEEKTLVILQLQDLSDLGMNIAQADTIVIPWSQSLQDVMQQAQSRCKN